MHVFILGICGTFMGNVARLARELGCEVSGMDANTYPPMSDILAEQSVNLIEGYDPIDLPDSIDLVVVGNVMRADHPIVTEIKKRDIPMISAPAWIMKYACERRQVIAVSGTHGKTTTTTLIVHLLQSAGKNPGYMIAGVPQAGEQSAALGEAPYFVIEADEYDTAFFDKRAKLMSYDPWVWVVNNLEFDHGDIYDSIEAIESVFREKADTLTEGSYAVIAADDSRVQAVMRNTNAHQVSFGLLSGDWSVQSANKNGSSFELCHKDGGSVSVSWGMVGDHNLKNALAASAVAYLCGCSLDDIAEGLSSFRGVKRRFECLGEINGVTLYDDFAHHPTAVGYVVRALRASMEAGRLIAVVYFASNTMRSGGHDPELFQEALGEADEVYLLANSDDVSFLETVSGLLDSPSCVVSTQEELANALKEKAQSGDKILFMGNRSMHQVQKALLER